MEEEQTEIEQRSGDGLTVYQEMGFLKVPSARAHH